MKRPIVFDGEEARKMGLIEALIIQKIREGNSEVSELKKELNFIYVKDIETAIKKMVDNGAVYFNGIKVSLEPLKSTVFDIKHSYDETFNEIWSYYNGDKTNKGSKKTAYQRYSKYPFHKLPVEIQKRVIDEYRTSTSDVKYMKHFATFLSEEIYEEYAPNVCNIKTKNDQRIEGYLVGDQFYYLTIDGKYTSFDLSGKVEIYKNNGVLNCD